MRFACIIVWAVLFSIVTAAMGQDAAVPGRRADVIASLVDAQGKVLWSLRLSADLVSVNSDKNGQQKAQRFQLTKPAKVSQTIETTGPATTRPTKWLGRRELEVTDLIVIGGYCNIALSVNEKTPYGSAEQPEYGVAGVTTHITVQNGKEMWIGGTNDLQYMLRVTVTDGQSERAEKPERP